MCFLDFQCVCVVSVALRQPAAYRSGTGSGKRGEDGGWVGGTGKGKEAWED